MYTAPNANSGISAKDGLLAWAKGAQAWMDDRGRKAWIFATIVAFILAWPVGLGLLIYIIWSKRVFNRSCGMKSGYSSDRSGPWGRHGGAMGFAGTMRSSGNAAFDAYKADTIRRLQDEQEAFEAFLQRLRDAKDKSEFDSFMADRAKQGQSSDVTKASDVTDSSDMTGPKSDN